MPIWIPRNQNLAIRIIKKKLKDKVFLEIRYFLKKKDIWFPLKKGILIPEVLFSDFVLGVSAALEGEVEEDKKMTGNIEEFLEEVEDDRESEKTES